MPQHITASQRKLIASLRHSRDRREQGLFVLEGTRSVIDTAAAFRVKWIVATDRWLCENADKLPETDIPVLTAHPDEIHRMSSVVTPQGVLAVCHIPAPAENFDIRPDELILALDCIQDPGNLGTILRIADWFGIRRIIASPDTVDIYNPKVINATMGAVARVEVTYAPLPPLLRNAAASGMEIYGTFLDGEPLHSADLTPGGIIVMGNEGNGISPATAEAVTRRITISAYPPGHHTVESLNVGVAAAITVAEFRTRLQKNG